MIDISVWRLKYFQTNIFKEDKSSEKALVDVRELKALSTQALFQKHGGVRMKNKYKFPEHPTNLLYKRF